MSTRSLVPIVAGIVVLSAVPTAGQTGASLNRVGSGARAAGMGDAFVAVSDDGTAASWNPAGLAQLRQPELSFVYVVRDRHLALDRMRSPDERFAYSSRAHDYTTASPDFASVAVPFSVARRAVTLQAGWHRIYQLEGDFSGSTDRRDMGAPDVPLSTITLNNRLGGNIDILSLAGALKVTGHLSLGGSLDLWRGAWTERFAAVDAPAGGEAPQFFARTAAHRARATNVSVGLLLTYPSWNVGLVHHGGFWSGYRIRGSVHATATPPLSLDLSGARFRFPRSVAAGVARRFPGGWTVAAAITHDGWKDTLIDGIPGRPGAVNFFDELPPDITSTRNTVSVNVGAEHLVVREGWLLPLRLGYGWEPQGAMDSFRRDPVGFHCVSAGAGYNTNRFKFDAAVQYRWAGFDTSEVFTVATALHPGPATRDAAGHASTREWRLKVSAIYRIQDTERLRALVRKLLG